MARTEAQKNADRSYEKKREARSKVWAGVVYPESAPQDWQDKLRELLIDSFISPLHDKDTNADGEVKKAHWHVMLMFGSMKTASQAKEAFQSFGCTVEPQRVRNTRGMARYLCHMDNPDKYDILVQMQDWCDANKVYGYATLVRYARSNRPDWFRCLADNGTVMMKEYLKSARWEDGLNEKEREIANLKVKRDRSEEGR